jgi:hypothetical protein
MSVQALTWALDYPAASTTHKVVLLVLANYADDDGGCFPGQARIARQTVLSERGVRKVLAELEAAGLIRREHRYREGQGGRTSDRIYLALDGNAAPGAAISGGGIPAPQRGHTGTSPRTIPAPGAGHELSVEPLEEPSVSPLPPAVATPAPATPPGRSHDLAFAAFWQAYPRKVGKPKARQAWERALRRQPDPAAIVAGAQRYAADPARYDEYTAHPTTWLNRDGWDDPALPARTGRGTNPALQQLARMSSRPAAGPIGGLFALPGASP